MSKIVDIESSRSAATQSLGETLAAQVIDKVKATADWETPIQDLMFFRRDETTGPCPCMVEPSVVLVAQGQKEMLIGDQSYPYDASHFLITSLDLPANSQVVQASPEQPCVGLALKLDMRMLAELISQGNLSIPRQRSDGKSVGLGTVTPSLLEPFTRLLRLLDEPESIEVLAPMIKREIHFRLLQSDQTSRLRQIASVDSHTYRISKAIDWIKSNYALPLKIEELAAHVQMSSPTFHHHFRQLTAMSPLQYQKRLRLNEAKRLMLNEHLDASSAGFQVGYESPSQFSREYSRLFGTPPKRDIEALRRMAQMPTASVSQPLN